MKSPKFRLRSKDLSVVVTPAAIKDVWKNTVRTAMRRQLIEDPIELYDLHLHISSVAGSIANRVVNCDYQPRPPKRVLVEKSKGLCRQLVVPHPHDCLVLQCLSDSLHPALRSHAPHPNAFYQPDRGMNNRPKLSYGGRRAWLNFQKAILDFSKRRKVLIVTDIANFYDSISYSHLRNILSDYMPEHKEAVLDLTLHVLGAMLWQPDYMPRVEIGLPQIALDAPRLLANACLFELDKFIASYKTLDYARYMDDIDVGVDSVRDAKPVLRDLDLTLQSRQIRLNAGKTKILIGDQIGHYFRVRQNHILDLLQERIEGHPTRIAEHRRTLARLFHGWNRRGIYDGEGNGEKILKRVINLASKIDIAIPVSDVSSLIYLRPNLREEVFRYASRVTGGERYIPTFIQFIKDPSVVDDACALMLAYNLVEMRAANVFKQRKEISATANWMLSHDRKDTWTYAAIWLLSKYGSSKQLMDAVDQSYTVWQSDYHLGRLVAALEPMILMKDQPRFAALIRASRNVGAAEVHSFFADIWTDGRVAVGLKKFLRAQNGNRNKISHPKWIVLLQVMNSPAVPIAVKRELRNVHTMALSDRYYRARGRRFLKF